MEKGLCAASFLLLHPRKEGSKTKKYEAVCGVWWHVPTAPAGRVKQGSKFDANLGYISRPYLKMPPHTHAHLRMHTHTHTEGEGKGELYSSFQCCHQTFVIMIDLSQVMHKE